MRPHRLHAACYDLLTAPLEREVLGPRRTALLSDLAGHVLDVGAGTGANIGYLRIADHIVAAEPDPAMRRRLARRVAEAPVPVKVAVAAAEALPYPDDAAAVECAGFRWASVETFQPIPAWIPASPMLQGVAVTDRRN